MICLQSVRTYRYLIILIVTFAPIQYIIDDGDIKSWLGYIIHMSENKSTFFVIPNEKTILFK